MSLATMLTRRATVVRPTAGVGDRYGDATDTWADVATWAAWLEQTDSVEIQIGRDTVISNWRIALEPAADVQALDRIRMDDGAVFEVMGRPARAGATLEDHVEARLREVEG